MLTDDQIRAAYLKSGLLYKMTDNHLMQARAFIKALFDDATPVGYLDGTTFATEEWELDLPEPIYRRFE